MAANFLERMGGRIRERREYMGFSRATLARKMAGKVNENQVYRWENGKHQPNPDTLEELARVLECDVSYFMAPPLEKELETPDLMGGEASQLDRIELQVQQLRTQVQELTQALHQQAEALHAETTARIAAEAEQANTQSDTPAAKAAGTAR